MQHIFHTFLARMRRSFLLWIVFLIQASSLEAAKLSKEISEMKEAVVVLQERMIDISKQLQGLEGEKKTPEKVEFSLSTPTFRSSFLGISHFIKQRSEKFFDGIGEMYDMFGQKPVLIPLWKSFALAYGTSVLLAVFTVVLGGYFLRRRVFRVSGEPHNLQSMARIIFLLLLFLVPYFFVSIMVSVGLEQWGMITKERHAEIMFFPVHLYVTWALFYWIRIVFSSYNDSREILGVTPSGSYQGAMWLRFAVVMYALGFLWFALLPIFAKTSHLVDNTLLDSMVMGVSLCLLRSLRILRKNLVSSPKRLSMLQFIYVVRMLIWIICACWFVDRAILIHFGLPLTLTFVGILFFGTIENLLHRIRVIFIWRWRERFPILRRYRGGFPVVRAITRGVLGVCLLLVWSNYLWNQDLASFIHVLKTIMESPFVEAATDAIIVIVVAWLLVKGGTRSLRYYVEERKISDSAENNFFTSRLKTLMAMLKGILYIIVWIPAISIIFSKIWGAGNLSALFTSVGVASFGLTFGFQSVVRDFITGFFIILENNLMVGDNVEIDQRSGTVEAITMRTLKIRSDTGMLLAIPFGSVTVIGNKNRIFCAVVMNISVPYGEKVEMIYALIEKAFFSTKRAVNLQGKVMEPLDIRGIQEVTSYSMVIQVKIKTAPNFQEAARRTFTAQLKRVFDDAGVKLPQAPHGVAKAEPSLTNTFLS